eukprot:m51a1_g9155 putative transcription elongation factor b polypeptide 1 (110) ;mRNA; r:125431-125893
MADKMSPMPQPGEYVRLKSSDNHEFIVHRECAMISGTIKSMLGGPGSFAEQQQGEVSFQEISTPILEKVVQYFYYKVKYSPGAGAETPEFPIEPDIALELLMAANFLDT